MADEHRPGGEGGSQHGAAGFEELERRRRDLEAAVAAREGRRPEGASPRTGYGQALKLSSEFIAGVGVGIALGWGFDKLAGTSPWGLIVFLLLGFGAGVLNVMRSAGVVAQQGASPSKPDDAVRREK